MSATAIILAISVAIAIFTYMAFNLKSEGEGTAAVWKVLCLIIAMLLMVLLAWGASKANQQCLIVADNLSADGYSLVCKEGPMPMGSTMLKLMLVVCLIFFVWISVALFISSVNYLRETGKM